MLQQFSPAAVTTSKAVTINNVQAVASYSWIDAPVPTIAVPGSPGIWAANPKRVSQDSGLVFIDQNAYRMGDQKSPLTPIFVAIDNLNGYNFAGLDFVSDRNNLRKLLRWATGAAGQADFRIDVEIAGTTCLFTRREAQNSEMVSGFKGFGHEYEKAATRHPKGCEKATGHHRIISMKFGALNILLRFEVDACLPANTEVDDLTSAFTNLGVSSQSSQQKIVSTPSAHLGIAVVHTIPRELVPQSSLIEIKTRASHKALDWEEAYPQLYLSQTAYLYLAKHERGAFREPEKIQLAGPSMKVHAEYAQVGMGRLEAVLTAVLAAVRKQGQGVGLSLVCEGGKLALYKRKEGTGIGVGRDILDKFK